MANNRVALEVSPGEVHAIVGENGAGKSTLMKILYGMQRPDEGTIRVNGAEAHFRSPKDAIAAGIGMVHQHFMLADNLTVLENVVLGSEPTLGPVIDFARAKERIKKLSGSYGLPLNPDRLVEDLAVGERQRVEIIKVLYRGARILILDEPTAVLVPSEVDDLFDHLRELKQEGVTVIFISHKLEEVLVLADTITVMRAGRTVATVKPQDVSRRQLAELMVGSELPRPETKESTVRDEVAMSVTALTVRTPGGRVLLDSLSFDIRRGQVVGIAGVEGNGQRELVEAIMGLAPVIEGRIRLDPGGRQASDTSPRTARTWDCCSRRRCGRTPCWDTRPNPPSLEVRGSTWPVPGIGPARWSTAFAWRRRAWTCLPTRCREGTSRS